MTAPRKCYGCAGTGRRGVSECGVCGGAGELTRPYVQAHADSFRRGALGAGGERSQARLTVVPVRTRRRRRGPETDPER